jgi:hypothetical protein
VALLVAALHLARHLRPERLTRELTLALTAEAALMLLRAGCQQSSATSPTTGYPVAPPGGPAW